MSNPKRNRNACAACNHHHKRCPEGCPLAPYFPAHSSRDFVNAHKLFGKRNILKILKNVDEPLKEDAMKFIKDVANIHAKKPVGGVLAEFSRLQSMVDSMKWQLECIKQQRDWEQYSFQQFILEQQGLGVGSSNWNLVGEQECGTSGLVNFPVTFSAGLNNVAADQPSTSQDLVPSGGQHGQSFGSIYPPMPYGGLNVADQSLGFGSPIYVSGYQDLHQSWQEHGGASSSIDPTMPSGGPTVADQPLGYGHHEIRQNDRPHVLCSRDLDQSRHGQWGTSSMFLTQSSVGLFNESSSFSEDHPLHVSGPRVFQSKQEHPGSSDFLVPPTSSTGLVADKYLSLGHEMRQSGPVVLGSQDLGQSRQGQWGSSDSMFQALSSGGLVNESSSFSEDHLLYVPGPQVFQSRQQNHGTSDFIFPTTSCTRLDSDHSLSLGLGMRQGVPGVLGPQDLVYQSSIGNSDCIFPTTSSTVLDADQSLSLGFDMRQTVPVVLSPPDLVDQSSDKVTPMEEQQENIPQEPAKRRKRKTRDR